MLFVAIYTQCKQFLPFLTLIINESLPYFICILSLSDVNTVPSHMQKQEMTYSEGYHVCAVRRHYSHSMIEVNDAIQRNEVPFIEWILELFLFEKCPVLMKGQESFHFYQNPEV